MNQKLLDIYTDYLICQNQYATATGLASLLDGEVSHVKSHVFLIRMNSHQKTFGNMSKKKSELMKPNKEEFLLLTTPSKKKHTQLKMTPFAGIIHMLKALY